MCSEIHTFLNENNIYLTDMLVYMDTLLLNDCMVFCGEEVPHLFMQTH